MEAQGHLTETAASESDVTGESEAAPDQAGYESRSLQSDQLPWEQGTTTSTTEVPEPEVSTTVNEAALPWEAAAGGLAAAGAAAASSLAPAESEQSPLATPDEPAEPRGEDSDALRAELDALRDQLAQVEQERDNAMALQSSFVEPAELDAVRSELEQTPRSTSRRP